LFVEVRHLARKLRVSDVEDAHAGRDETAGHEAWVGPARQGAVVPGYTAECSGAGTGSARRDSPVLGVVDLQLMSELRDACLGF
jgi:hypothetical protein